MHTLSAVAIRLASPSSGAGLARLKLAHSMGTADVAVGSKTEVVFGDGMVSFCINNGHSLTAHSVILA
jgi:hypothetical protein